LERIPEVYWKYSSARVLTTELLEGIPLHDIMQAIWNGDDAYLQDLEARGYSRQRISRHIDWNMLNGIYVNGYFHADIHPANLIILPGNGIGYVDFGIVGVLTDDVRESLVQYTWHFYKGNTERAVAQFARWMNPSSNTNMEAALRDLGALHDDYRLTLLDPTGRGGANGANGRNSSDSAANFAVNVLVVIRRHGMTFSPGVLAYVRTIITADTLRGELAPGSDFLSVIERFFSRFISLQGRDALSPGKLVGVVFDYSFRVRNLLGLVEDQQGMIENLAGIYSSTSQVARNAARRLRTIAIFALFAAAAVIFFRASPDAFSGRLFTNLSIDWFTLAIFAVVVVLVVSVLTESRQVEEDSPRASGPGRATDRQWQEPRA